MCSGTILKKIILSIALVFVLPLIYSESLNGGISSQTDLVNGFFRYIYSFSFRSADSLLFIMQKSEMDKPAMYNIGANLAWWKLLSGDSVNSNIKRCNYDLEESIRLLQKEKKDNSTGTLNLIYSYSLKARLENYNGNTLKALIYFYRSAGLIRPYVNSDKRDEKLNLMLGLYLYFMDYIENEYYMSHALFLSYPHGDRAKGLKYLSDCSDSKNEMIRTEANYFLLKIYANVENDYQKAYENSEFLTRQYPENLVYAIEKLKLMMHLKAKNEVYLFRVKLIEQISHSASLSNDQKNHFISLIELPDKQGI